MAKVSVIIPTHNRPELLKRSLQSVLVQTYKDIEVVVVDDGIKQRSEVVIQELDDPRIKYFKHEQERGGSAARNTGIKHASGEFLAFQDDDDEWLPEKLGVQMSKFERTSSDVGFCFSAATMVYDDHDETSNVPEGVANYFDAAIGNFSGFLTVTLILKKEVLEKVGGFDEALPSHQEIDLVIRMARHYKGLGVNKSLVRVNMSAHESIGRDLKKRIAGREIIMKKYMEDFKKDPYLLALNYYWLGLFYRDDGQIPVARSKFLKAFRIDHRLLYLRHYLSLIWGYKFFRLIKKIGYRNI